MKPKKEAAPQQDTAGPRSLRAFMVGGIAGGLLLFMLSIGLHVNTTSLNQVYVAKVSAQSGKAIVLAEGQDVCACVESYASIVKHGQRMAALRPVVVGHLLRSSGGLF